MWFTFLLLFHSLSPVFVSPNFHRLAPPAGGLRPPYLQSRLVRAVLDSCNTRPTTRSRLIMVHKRVRWRVIALLLCGTRRGIEHQPHVAGLGRAGSGGHSTELDAVGSHFFPLRSSLLFTHIVCAPVRRRATNNPPIHPPNNPPKNDPQRDLLGHPCRGCACVIHTRLRSRRTVLEWVQDRCGWRSGMGTCTPPETLAKLLQRYRRAAGLTQEELAERAHLSVRGISNLERGVRRQPQRSTVTLLAEALGLEGTERAALLAAAR